MLLDSEVISTLAERFPALIRQGLMLRIVRLTSAAAVVLSIWLYLLQDKSLKDYRLHIAAVMLTNMPGVLNYRHHIV